MSETRKCGSCGYQFEPLGPWHLVCRECYRDAKRQEFPELQAENDSLRIANRKLKAERTQVHNEARPDRFAQTGHH